MYAGYALLYWYYIGPAPEDGAAASAAMAATATQRHAMVEIFAELPLEPGGLNEPLLYDVIA